MLLITLGINILTIVLAWRILMNSSEILAKLVDLKASVDALIAIPSNPPPEDLQPIGDAIDAIKAEIDNKLTAPLG